MQRGGVVNLQGGGPVGMDHDKFISSVAQRSGRQVIVVKRPARISMPLQEQEHSFSPPAEEINMVDLAQHIHRINGARL